MFLQKHRVFQKIKLKNRNQIKKIFKDNYCKKPEYKLFQ